MEDIIEGACNPCRPWPRVAAGINQVMVADRHKDHGGHWGGHWGHGHGDYSLTHDSLLRETEACFRAVGAEFVSVNNRIADAATAAALAAANTDKLILASTAQVKDQAAANFAALQLQAASNFGALQLQAERNRADQLLAIKECCCETQVVVRAEGEKTRDQASSFKIRDLERAIDRKPCCYGGYDHRGPMVATQVG